ncbi:MAG: ABC transporter substrate-binding protein [Oscillospiraceae bacterium]|nr:ABC transporter substrate-binding protein [Oscillospiraceae bacterium]
MKRIISLIVSVSLILLLFACAAADDNKTSVERLVSGYYISTSACIALGLSERLVGIEARADTRPIYSLAAPELLELPNLGTARDFNLEACLALNPDLVILPARLQDAADTLTDMGVSVLLVNPESFDEITHMFRLIGEATGAGERADKLIEWITKIRSDINERTKGISSRPSVYISGVSSWLTTAPKDMFQSSLVELAGGVNAAAHIAGRSWTEISYEELLAMNPNVIILPAEASYEIKDVLTDTALSQLSAVQNKAVYKMPSDYEAWDSPVPAGMLGALWLLNILHEDLIAQDELDQETADFYMEFFGIN